MGDLLIVMSASLTKYHGLGNDFLVSVDPADLPGDGEVDDDFVVAICDRHRGIGADGLLVARTPTRGPSPGGTGGTRATNGAAGRRAHVRMELRNADGGRAETSGNGLRCLALAVVDAGLVAGPEVVIETEAGLREVTILERTSDTCASVRAEMGRVTVGPEERAPLLDAGWQARHVDAGNPHLVLIGSGLEGVDISALGRALEGACPGGQNVEVVAPAAGGGLEMLVWERGAGLTEACGTGSSAAAAAARAAGLVGERVEVHNPGGTLVVDLEGDALNPTVWLTGSACRIARIEIALSEVDVLG
jgi:diaminopimelate epimerase